MTHLVPVLRPVLGSPFRRASLYRAAGELPSWHIAPARTGNVRDLVTGADLVTFTNSSPAWGFNSSGVLVQPTANTPFIEYDPATGSALGWRIWDAVTNLIVRSEDFTVSPWALFGTASRSANVTTAPNGTLTADSVTLPIGSGIYQSTSGSANTTYNFSIWLRADSAQTVRLVINTNLSDPTVLTVNVTTQWQRFSITKTTATGTTSWTAQLDTGNGGAFYVWGAQLTTGATLAPYVPTGALTASSTADVASITGSAFAGIWNPTEDTMYLDGYVVSRGTPNSFPRMLAAVGSNPGTDEIGLYTRVSLDADDGKGFAAATISGVSQVDLTPLSGATTNNIKAAYAFRANDFALCNNGIPPSGSSIDNSGNLPTVNGLRIYGQARFQPQPNGYIREAAIFKSRRPNSNLQSMTQ